MRKILIISFVFLAALMFVSRLNRELMADGGVFPSTEHGGTSDPNDNGVNSGAQRGAFTAADCVNCHEQHASYGGSEPAPNAPAGPDDMLLMADDATSGNEVCFYCHTSVITLGSNYNSASFRSWPGDTVYDSLRTSNSGHGANTGTNSDNYWPGTNPPARSSADAGKCVNCHNPHGRSWNATGDNSGSGQINPTGTNPTPQMINRIEENLCLGCHNATGPTNAADIASQLALGTNVGGTGNYYNHPITRDAAASDRTPSYHNLLESKDLYQNLTAGPPEQTPRHVECVDCHNPHYAGYGGSAGSDVHSLGTNVASPVLYGVWGVRPNTGDPTVAANWPTDGAVDSLPSPPTWVLNKIDPASEDADVDYEWEICMRCHSSYSYGNYMPSFTGMNTMTDISKEINPNNIAHHAVVRPGKQTLPTANATITAQYKGNYTFWNNGAGTDPLSATLYCSDCHTSSNMGDPAGPHGSANPWLVGSWCENNATFLTGMTTPNCATAEHTVICYKCHRFDVYFDNAASAGQWGSRGSAPHGNSNHHDVTTNTWGIHCMTCHGGRGPGEIHGTNSGIGDQGGATNMGENFMNGACLNGFTYDNGSRLLCWTTPTSGGGSGDGTYCVNGGCDGQHSGAKYAYPYNY